MMEFLDELRKLITQTTNNAEIAQSVIDEVVGQFGGETVYIRANSARIRNERIKDDFERGLTVPKLANKYLLSSRTIRKVLKS